MQEKRRLATKDAENAREEEIGHKRRGKCKRRRDWPQKTRNGTKKEREEQSQGALLRPGRHLLLFVHFCVSRGQFLLYSFPSACRGGLRVGFSQASSASKKALRSAL
jgi:hypothetical protein